MCRLPFCVTKLGIASFSSPLQPWHLINSSTVLERPSLVLRTPNFLSFLPPLFSFFSFFSFLFFPLHRRSPSSSSFLLPAPLLAASRLGTSRPMRRMKISPGLLRVGPFLLGCSALVVILPFSSFVSYLWHSRPATIKNHRQPPPMTAIGPDQTPDPASNDIKHNAQLTI